MKRRGKVLKTLLLLLIVVVMVCYVLIQTRWAAGMLSRWVSSHSEYHLSVGKISHHWSTLGELDLSEVALTSNHSATALSAKQVLLGLNWQQLMEPRHFKSLQLQDGELTLTADTSWLSITSSLLKLANMTVKNSTGPWQWQSEHVQAGITPWKPTTHSPFGDDAQFQLSAGSITLNGITATHLLVQGEVHQQQWQLNNIGADIAQGTVTGSVSRSAEGNWLVESLRLSDIRFQSAATLDELWQQVAKLPSMTLKRFDLLNTKLEGKEWALSDVNLNLRGITLNQGNWQSEEGTVTFNATDVVNQDVRFTDPIIDLSLSDNGIVINEFSTRWQDGLVRSRGSWSRINKRLQLEELVLATLNYTLPLDWRQRWQQPLPDWLHEVYITRLVTNRNLLIDINPAFPFQLTSVDGIGNNLLLAQQQQWGIWSGMLNLTASAATFNKVDLRHLSLALQADQQHINLTELSALSNDGLLEASANIEQQTTFPFSLNLTGRGVPLEILHQWGWPTTSQQNSLLLQLQLTGELGTSVPFAPNGTLQLTGSDEQIQHQTMQQGKLTTEVQRQEQGPAH